MIQSILDEIPGVGQKRKKLLLKHFGSVKKMSKLRLRISLKIGIPKNVAESIVQTLQNSEE